MTVDGGRRAFLIGLAAVAAAPVPAARADLALVGYNDMAEMLAALNAAFARRHPGVRITTDLPGTKQAPAALAEGRATLAPMGAEFTPAQLAAYRAATGGEPVGFRIAHASLDPRALSGPNALFVHRDHPLRAIDLATAARLFTRAGPRRWADAGVTGAWAERPLRLAGMAPETALACEFAAAAFPGVPFAADYRGLAQSRDVVALIGADPAMLGFAARNRATDAVRALGVSAGPSAPPVDATAATLRAGRYPLDRHLWLFARADPPPWARRYLAFALSAEGQAIVDAGSLGYLSLGEEERRRERAKLDR